MVFDNKYAAEIHLIMFKAMSEALSESSAKPYRDIWVDMMAYVIAIQYPRIAESFKKHKPELQDVIGIKFEYPFEQFIEDIAGIEYSISKTLASCGNQQSLN